MVRSSFGIAAALLLLAAVTPGWGGQLYLYSPKTVDAPRAAGGGTDILVQEVPVRKGDTLYSLSRRYIGRGSYYPQILLFNDIRNPDLIYAGSSLKLPVPPEKDQRAGEARPAIPAVKSSSASQPQPAIASKRENRHRPAFATAQQAIAASASVEGDSGQKLFERGVAAYRRNDCNAALELFDRFLRANPASSLTADADLYKAECYLKQSNQ